MTKNEFFNILMDGLKNIPEKELGEIISYYNNKFNLRLAAGQTESEIINELGNPNLIVKKYLDQISNSTLDSNTNLNDIDINNDSNIKSSIYNTHSIEADQRTIPPNTYSDYYTISTNNKVNINLNDFNNKDDSSAKYSSCNQSSKNSSNKIPKFNINTILKICIVILGLIIFSPVATGIIGGVIGIFGAAIGLFAGGIGILVRGTFASLMVLPNIPGFISNFPYPVTVLFSLGSICLSILLLLIFYYLCKFFVKLLIKFFNFLKFNGGNL